VLVPGGPIDAASPDGHDSEPTPRADGISIPPIMVGVERLLGRVVDEQGQGVPEAAVRCVPYCFEAQTPQSDMRFGTRTDAGGCFELAQLPFTQSYEITAATKTRFGHVTVDGRPPAGVVLVPAPTLYYRLLSFVDDNGTPLRVTGLQVQGVFVGAFASTAGPMAHDFSARLRQMGVVLPVNDNQIAAFYDSTPPADDPGARFRYPGHEAVVLPTRLRPVSEWPASDTVSLSCDSDDDEVVFDVQFPKVDWPPEWDDPPDIRIIWIWVDRSAGMILTRDSHCIVGKRDRPFQLRASYQVAGDSPLGYDVREERDRRVIVEPKFPALGVVTLCYQDGGAVSSILVNGVLQLRGVNEWPGKARIGPLPVGRYEAMVWRVGGRPGVGVEPFSFDVREGHAVVQWR
jgi:hypothetical protein